MIAPMLLTLGACVDKNDLFNPSAADDLAYAKIVPNVEIAPNEQFSLTQSYSLPTQPGMVTIMMQGDDTLAISDHEINVNIPKSMTPKIVGSQKKSARDTINDESLPTDITVMYTQTASLAGYVPGTSTTNEEYVMMFEDSPVDCDYDYNDVVMVVKKRVKIKDDKALVSVAVKPLAYGSARNIEFGCAVGNLSGTYDVFQLSDNVKKDFFGNSVVNNKTYSDIIKLKVYKCNNIDSIYGFNPKSISLTSAFKAFKFDRDSVETRVSAYEAAKDEYDETIPGTYDPETGLKSEDQIIHHDAESAKDAVYKTDVVDNDGFYLIAPFEINKDQADNLHFYIQPVLPLSYTRNSTITVNGQSYTGKIKYTSEFRYMLFAGDVDLKANTHLPYGISIPVKVLNDKTNFCWPYESQPIWVGLPGFEKWLNGENIDGTWINNAFPEDIYGDEQVFKAKLLVNGPAKKDLTIGIENAYEKIDWTEFVVKEPTKQLQQKVTETQQDVTPTE